MADQTANYKDTLNLPQTDFPMRGQLPQTEPKRIEYWQQNKIYEKMIERRAQSPSFVMPDGPPYANGNIHVGHVLNKVLKDIVIKYKTMAGNKAVFIPGWDCHGLPIELKVTKALGKKRAELSDKELRDLCRKEASQWIDTQRQQFIRLGVLADWYNPYLTMDPEYEAEEVRVLAQVLRNGILFRGEKPVYWCPALQTALAAAEVEYHDHKSPSIYVKFYVEQEKERLGVSDKPVAFVIWTTTPWTIPANYAISLHPEFEYGVYDTGQEYLVVAKGLKESVEQATGLKLAEKRTFKGSEAEGIKARHPFMNRDSLLILGEHVTLEAGTGCVHTAPGHGLDDYHMGLKYNLPVHSPVDPGGRYTEDVPQYQGVKIWAANSQIVDDLKESGHLLAHTEITHSYPHNPRSKTPLIFRATPQWFVRMDDPNYNLRQKALNAIETKIKFVPQWGTQRLQSMVTNSPDWCLSRQRIWGVPIPVFYCANCGEALAKPEIMEKVADVMEKTGEGLEAFYSHPVEEFVAGEKCDKCNHTEFTRSRDILDVWFDSGVCHTAVQKKREGLGFPADIYLEGSDQHRGWFQTSLLSSLASNGEPPYKALITHGFVNDAQGHKMSKSKGNVIDPAEIFNKNGAEILRLWVAYEDYGQDVSVGNEIFQRITETYRRMRNTLRFLLGNLSDFDPEKDSVAFSDMSPLDQWALNRLNDVTRKVEDAYETYNFYKAYHALNYFFTVDLSATYLDILKDRLYTWKKDGPARRGSQTVLFETLSRLVGLMAPILSFLAEETYGYLPGKKPESVFLTDFPKANPEWDKPELLSKFDELFEIRAEASKKLEDLRVNKVIGSSLEAVINLTADNKRLPLLKEFEPHLRELLIVSQVNISAGETNSLEAVRAPGEKCERCWHYTTELGKVAKWPNICPKCVEALS